MITDLNKILVEWAYRTNDGKPDVKNNAKLLTLESVLKDFGWSEEARAELLYTLMEQPSDRERLMKQVIKYKNKDGEDKEITVGGALKQGEEHPAYEKAKQITDTGDDKQQSKGLEPDDFERFSDKNKPDEKEKGDEQPKGRESEKVKKLNQEKANNATSEFNEGQLSEDGVSDEEFENNSIIQKVEDEIPIEELEKHLPEPSPFPKKYLKVLHRMLNTKKAGGVKISDFTDAAGGGTISSTAGEIMTMMITSIDDDSEADALLDKLEEHTKNKNNKGAIIDKSWVKSAREVRENIRRRYDNQFGEGNWNFKNAAWDIENEVEALGMEDYKRDKGFSTDVYFTVEVDGEIIIDEVSLKKDKLANLLNATTGRVPDIIVRGKASSEDLQEYDRLVTEVDSLKGVKGSDAKRKRDEANKKIKEIQNKYNAGVPDNVDVEKVKRKQAQLHRESLKENNDEIKDAVSNFNSMSKEEQLRVLESVRKKLNQKPGWAEANLEKIKKLLSDTTDGELSLDAVKQMMGGKGDLRSVQKNSMILQSIAAEQNPDGGSSKAIDGIINNSHDHAKAVADHLLGDDSAKQGLLKSIREDFPLKSLMSGEENMALGDLSADQQTLRDIFGVSSFEEVEENLKVRDEPPPSSIIYSVDGGEDIEVAIINTRPDGIGYGTNWKLEMKLHPELANRMEALKDVDR